jgi:hypothetical protein
MSTNYVLPQPIIHQIFRQRVAAPVRRQHACLIGPQAQVLRYSEASEKAQIYLGQYDNVGELIGGDYKKCYSWPNRPTGAIVDQTDTKLFIDDALLRMFRDTSSTIEKTASNKLRHPTIKFATNGDSARSAQLLRDIKAGDIVSVTAGSDTLYSYVKDVEGDTVAAELSAVEPDAANAASQSRSVVVTYGDDNEGDVTATGSATLYDGLADGLISDTYVVTVTQASTGNDATTARLRVVSASGKDDAYDVTPNAWGVATSIGANGFRATFSSSAQDFIEGDTFTFAVNQLWEAPELTISGTYTGTKDRVYMVEVTKGGLWADSPQIKVTTADASDRSGPTTITIASTVGTTTTSAPGDPYTVAVALGQHGILGRFSDEGLRKGDKYVFTATAATEGDMKTLVLAHTLPTGIALNDDSEDIQLSIYIRKNIEVAKKHVGTPGAYTFGQSATQICVFADLQATDASWVDEDGALVPLDVISDSVVPASNKMYVEYRCWLQQNVGVLNSLSDISDIEQIAGRRSKTIR